MWGAISIALLIALVLLCAVLIGTPKLFRAALARNPALADPDSWADADGTRYDLTISYRDDNGDPWTPIGWLTPFDGIPIPYVECNSLSTDIETVIREFGPLIPDFEDIG